MRGKTVTGGYPLESTVAAAISAEPTFEIMWQQDLDPTFRPFAIAVFHIAKAKPLLPEKFRALVREIITAKRHLLLTRLLGRAVETGVIRLLPKTEWTSFNRQDWLNFLEAVSDADIRRSLGHVVFINRCLIQQIHRVPINLQLPRVFGVLNDLKISPKYWDRLELALTKYKRNEWASLVLAGNQIESIGSFWDYYFLCVEGRNRPFNLPPAVFSSKLLHPITSAEEMITEGLRMKNCLAHLIGRAVAGRNIYFRLHDEKFLTSELVSGAKGWRSGRIFGKKNQLIPLAQSTQIRDELDRIAKAIPTSTDAVNEKQRTNILGAFRLEASKVFPTTEIEKLSEALWNIRGRSRSWNDGAYAIFETKSGGYVQFLSSPDGLEYLCEIASHKYVPRVEKFMTETSVELIEKAGFLWPYGQANFKRWFSVTDQKDCTNLAAIALGILSKVYGHGGDTVHVKTHLP